MEIQLTDFENAAFAIFNINFYIPTSKVDENTKVAHHRNAVLEQKVPLPQTDLPSVSPRSDEYELMTINEIINDNPEKGYPGLLGLVNNYLYTLNIETQCEINKYLELIKKRANGTLMTAASWIRQCVQTHPEYKQDSVV
ncbi:hypothetical protein BGZ65_008004 [Modicella reniformis]|uniref:Glutamate--cysteine ligase n=1 Tax=Modicella reniformis TaxID=1440133 RepID=A0A9P6MF91_9FUNG|nr:hypothetical protein BGZ65_008004 [Modicella reniformis]